MKFEKDQAQSTVAVENNASETPEDSSIDQNPPKKLLVIPATNKKMRRKSVAHKAADVPLKNRLRSKSFCVEKFNATNEKLDINAPRTLRNRSKKNLIEKMVSDDDDSE